MPGLVGVGTGEEVVEVIIRYDAVNEEALTISKDRLEAVKAAADGTAASTGNLTRASEAHRTSLQAGLGVLLMSNSALNRMGLLSDSAAQSMSVLIGMIQTLVAAQRLMTLAANTDAAAQWSAAIARAAAWVAANPLMAAAVIGAIAATVAAVAALKVSGALAEGGTTLAPGRFLVGERGMEFVDLPAGTQVAPLDRAGGGGGTVNINIAGTPEAWSGYLLEQFVQRR